MTHAIWYRHWLEIRFRVTISAIVAALLCLLPVRAALLGATGPPPELDRFPWVAEHIRSSGTLLVFSIVLWGNGVRTGIVAPEHPSLYYTLTLPAARFTLIWTRFAVGAAATAALFAALLTTLAAALLVAGRGDPLGAMAATSVLAGLLAVALQAVILLLSLWDTDTDRLGIPASVLFLGIVAGVVISANTEFEVASSLEAVITNQAAPWSVAGVLVLIIAASLCLAAVTARRRDF